MSPVRANALCVPRRAIRAVPAAVGNRERLRFTLLPVADASEQTFYIMDHATVNWEWAREE